MAALDFTLTTKSIRSQSLDYDFRLHYPWQYRRFFDQSQVIKLRECVIFRVKNELGHFRLGITLKARGSSLDRNRVKRQIRENFRKHRLELGSYDYNVVIPSHKSIQHPYPQRLSRCLQSELPRALACF